MKKLFHVAKYQSIPLLYLEGMLFTYLYCKCKNENSLLLAQSLLNY